jgi:NAD(P)-dependent dehydrogenase (short-subunit alcohol dehydrogenase family)
VIVGVGPGFGYALARKLAEAGFDLALLTRDADRLQTLCEELRTNGIVAESYGMDATQETDVKSIFAKIVANYGPPSLVVYSLQEFGPGSVLNVSVPAFESAWKHNCLGAFLVSQAAGRVMKSVGSGSIILVGSTSSFIGREGHLNLAIGKFGQRALAQVLSRELWPLGVHVASVLIDADISEPGVESTEPVQSDPNDIALSILALHNQPRSAWSSEIDLRPWNEKFWEHC